MTLPLYPGTPGALTPPGLAGLGYSVKWSPTFFNQSQKAVNGASIDIGLSPYPLHNFELTYNFLRDSQYLYPPGSFPAANQYEFKVLMGFFLQMGGSLGRFLFDFIDDDAYVATGGASSPPSQPLCTTANGDGTTTVFTIARPMGVWLSLANNYLGIAEPVGYVNTLTAVYWNTSLQGGGTYTIDKTIPGNQKITFTGGAPPNNAIITISMTYYYYCKFADDTMTFEKFVNLLWSGQSVKIQSCRAGA